MTYTHMIIMTGKNPVFSQSLIDKTSTEYNSYCCGSSTVDQELAASTDCSKGGKYILELRTC